jgi:hypothetical protein
VLANGGLIHSDITVSVFFLQTLYTGWRWLNQPGPLRLVVFGASLGLAVISKLSGLLLLGSVGVLFLAVGLRLRPDRPSLPYVGPDALGRRVAWALCSGLAALGIVLVVVWIGYGGSFRIATLDTGPWAGIPLPSYLLALAFDQAANEGGRDLYLLGEIASGGWWYYFPVAFAVKAPLAISALFVLALAAPGLRPSRLGWWLAIPAAIYLAIAMFWLDITLGLRYLLPLFPLLYVFIATQLVPLGSGARRNAVVLLCSWLAVASLWIHPHYLAYFNEAVGGPAGGHRVLLESNLDWGQDLGTLADFLAERGNPPVQLAYFGPEKPAEHGIRSRPLQGCRPVSGLIAISANVREGLYRPHGGFGRRPKAGCYDWLSEHEPIAQPGYSIYVYDIPAAERAPGP